MKHDDFQMSSEDVLVRSNSVSLRFNIVSLWLQYIRMDILTYFLLISVKFKKTI